MSNRPFISTARHLPNIGDVCTIQTSEGNLKVYYHGYIEEPVFAGVSSGVRYIGHRNWQHFNEKYAALCELTAQGWFDSRQNGYPTRDASVWVYDTFSKAVVHCKYRDGLCKGWFPVVRSESFYEGNQIWRLVKIVEKVTYSDVPEDAPAAPKPPVAPAPETVQMTPAPVATGPVWHDGGVKAPSDGQYVWVNTGIHQLVCRYRQSDHLFVCVAGTEFGRGFYASICVWHTLLPPAAATPSLEANKAAWIDSRITVPSNKQTVWITAGPGCPVEEAVFKCEAECAQEWGASAWHLYAGTTRYNFYFWQPRPSERPAPMIGDRPLVEPPKPSLEANKGPVWNHGSITLPKHRQHVWVSIDETVMLCQYLSTDLQFEVLSGPDRCRRFARNLWWQAVLLPTERFDKLDNS